ncbi:MAG: AzlC family ABC transporter permease [Firmicutes bacterium]|nr:branched-chain amino acid transporter AzlC [Clostridiales bacterium]MBQ9931917.1 AzlC family ABC transporter permease [Bacillota bacterium]
MKKTFRQAFIHTLPVLAGYLFLGFGFGIILEANGFGIGLAFFMSLLIYAGAGQYAAVGLLSGGASLLTIGLTTFMINCRHLFYGISLLGKYKGAGIRKAYMIFGLTDETYALTSRDDRLIPREGRYDYYFLVTLLDHIYWIAGCVLGATVGTLVEFNSEGIDFVLTALFITIFLEQWLTSKKHAPAIIGIVATAACLVVFGSEKFLIPAMIVIAVALCLYKEDQSNA